MQISGGVASFIAGQIVAQSATGMIEHYDILGYVVVGTMAAMVGMMYYINRMVTERAAVQPVPSAMPVPEIAVETSI